MTPTATRPESVWTVLGGTPWRFLISAWPWRSLAYLVSTVATGLVSLVALFVVIGIGAITVPLVIGVFILGGLPRLGSIVAIVERRRLALMPDGVASLEEPPTASWRAVGYTVLLAMILWVVDALVALFVVVTVVTALISPLLAHFTEVSLGPWVIDSTSEAWPFALVATPVGFVIGAYVLTTLAAAQSSLARILLSPREEELEAHVSQLRRSRLQLVDAFETERKRIERDLHDGVQQRMVALTMLLGRAELDVPEGEALTLVRQAHREAESALADLREVVRGVHPRVLTDLGLGAAIREVADRMSIPVHVDVSLEERPPPQVEAAAYFVVSEGLANVAKHSGARSAAINARREDEALVVVVSDDGQGGAVVGEGTGLSGLVTRLDALGGTLVVTSPAGGPTQLRMESPWRVEG